MLNDAQKYRSKARNKYCIIKFVFKICETRNWQKTSKAVIKTTGFQLINLANKM